MSCKETPFSVLLFTSLSTPSRIRIRLAASNVLPRLSGTASYLQPKKYSPLPYCGSTEAPQQGCAATTRRLHFRFHAPGRRTLRPKCRCPSECLPILCASKWQIELDPSKSARVHKRRAFLPRLTLLIQLHLLLSPTAFDFVYRLVLFASLRTYSGRALV
jgi:hypothetical protein